MLTRRNLIAPIATGYLLFGVLWITLSDRWLQHLPDAASVSRLSATKGIVFVVISAGILGATLWAFTLPQGSKVDQIAASLGQGISDDRKSRVPVDVLVVVLSLSLLGIIWALPEGTALTVWAVLGLLPVALGAAMGGLAPGLLATGLVTAGTFLQLINAGSSGQAALEPALLRSAPLLLNGVVFSLLAHALRSALAQARADRALVQATFASTPDAVSVKDLDLRYRLVNESVLKTLGKDLSQITGRVVGEILPPESAQRITELDRRAVAEARAIRVEHQILCADGRTRVFESTHGPIFDAAGTTLGVYTVSRDVSGSRDALRAVQESESRLQLVLESVDGAIWDWNLPARSVHRSDRFIDLVRREMPPPSEQLGPFEGAVHASDSGRLAAALAEHLKGDSEVFQIEFRLPESAGQVYWLSAHGRVVERDADGHALRVVGILTDVTERREHRARLRQLSAAVEQSPASVMITDTRARIVYANAAFCRNTGYPLDQVIGRNPRMLASGHTPPETYQALWKALARGDTWQGEFINTRSDGVQVIETAVVGPIREADGSITHYVGVQHDISELKRAHVELDRHRNHLEALVAERAADVTQARDELAASNRFVRAITEAMPAMVSYWDRDLRCRFANAAYRSWFGIDEGQIIGMRVEDLLGAERYANAEPYLQRVMAGTPQRFQRGMTGPDGKVLATLVSYVPDFVEGQVQGFNVVVTDISDIKRAEVELAELNLRLARRAEQAEAATRAKSAFLANMSHEIRTPMNAIIGLNHLMLRTATEPTVRDRLSRVDQAARHLLQVINDILDLSKVEAGRIDLEDAEFSPDEIVDRAVGIVRPRVQEKALELVVDTWDLPARLIGDATRLSQILINLLGNAVKFTASGSVTLEAHVTSRDGERLRVRFSVIDTGTGIDPEQQARIFEPFEQADTSSTRKFDGTGLGLSLVRQFARLMGGDVGLHSKPGAGSRFWVDLQLQMAAEASDGARTELTGRRALLVDDRQQSAQATCRGLTSVGLSVERAESSVDAITRVSAKGLAPYDLVMLSHRPPAVDAMAILAELSRLGRLPLSKVIVLDDQDDLSSATGVPDEAFHLASGPLSPARLTRLLVDALAGRAPAPPLSRSQTSAERQLRERYEGRTVLLVEDNPVNQEVQQELLKAVGLSVVTAEDGLEAVAAVERQEFDLILMDMQMPRLDGLEATRRIRSAGHGTVPVIALTANAFSDVEAECIAAGMNAMVSKPVDPDQLYCVMVHWLSQARSHEASPAREAAC